MKRRVQTATIKIAVLSVCSAIRSVPAVADGMPTFSKEVAPILYRNCANCHRPGEIAPMSLLTYDQARPWAKSIREKVLTDQMPPWHATEPRGTFENDRRLTDAEKNTLVAWVDAGAPQGDPKDLPPAPKFAEGWQLGEPDLVLAIPKPYDVPASGTIAYQLFTVPTNLKEDKWIQSVEIRPGNRSVVHHILVFVREPTDARPEPAFVPAIPKAPAISNRAPEGAAPQRGQLTALIGTMAPGTSTMVFQPGSAAKVAAGSELVFQIHYTATGKPATDQSKIGFIFAKEPPRTEIRASSFLNSMLKIPAESPDHAVDSAIEFTQDSHITALFPHTHLRGKSWEYRLIYPDGQSRVVLSVPHYDFNWQTYYRFTVPIAAPKGSRLEATAHYDNSVNNRSNPDPTIEVRWGEQTWQEMQYSGISYYVDGNAKPAPAETAARPVALKAADMSGKWTGELRTPAGQTLPIVFTFKLDGDKVTGTVTLPMGDFAIADGKMDGERLQFGLSVNANGQQLVFRCTGQLSTEDQLKITMNGQMNFEVNAKRST